jgi:hypothetical protein
VSLEEKVAAAYEKAQTSLDPHDWRVYHALNGALHAERHPPPAPADTSGIPPWSEVSEPGTSEGPLR